MIFCLDPPKVTETFEGLTAAQDSNVNFKCSFDGHPSPHIQWFKDNIEIEDAGKFIIETKMTVSMLDIAEVGNEDSGEYKFVATNEYGSCECSATLNVISIDGKYLFVYQLEN